MEVVEICSNGGVETGAHIEEVVKEMVVVVTYGHAVVEETDVLLVERVVEEIYDHKVGLLGYMVVLDMMVGHNKTYHQHQHR
ncbi:unnamed protein product [Sphenostylis stenocarpa]|uniref:Uncharacterized protein n=1 Tax=Sphenostylis stenocarpa TaxID=92480 RepID=A0AA86W4R4_9FABA|nr:unnamed protein product [Sphenostylis stenocarpa]